MGCIYGLIDPRESERIRYVGKTSKTLEDRLLQHGSYSSDSPRTKLQKWLMSRKRDGIAVDAVVLEADPSDLDEAECRWIKQLGIENLVNGTVGGTGGTTHSGPRGPVTPEHYAAMKAARRLREIKRNHDWIPPEDRLAKPPLKGRKQSPERAAQSRIATLGKTRTEEHRQNYRNAWTPERRAAQAQAIRDYWIAKRAVHKE